LNSPPIFELLLIAAFGARGRFVSVLLVGLVLFGISLAVNSAVEPKTVAFAFFMPLILSAIMGTVSLGTYRARQEAWLPKTPRGRVFLAAFIWNCSLGFVALVVDQVVLHFKLLQRPPFAFPESLAVVAGLAAGFAVLAVFPRRGPQ
jgi:hypothetical protein